MLSGLPLGGSLSAEWELPPKLKFWLMKGANISGSMPNGWALPQTLAVRRRCRRMRREPGACCGFEEWQQAHGSTASRRPAFPLAEHGLAQQPADGLHPLGIYEPELARLLE